LCIHGREDASTALGRAEEAVETKGSMASKRARCPAERMEWSSEVMTVMIRQLPRQLTQSMFMEELTQRGFGGLFDFMYLPFDLKKGFNVGYGFVNFTRPEHADLFRREFDGAYIDEAMRHRSKPLHVHPASVQGYEANYEHFAQTKTGQRQDPQYSPIFLPHESSKEGADRDDLESELAVESTAAKEPEPTSARGSAEAPSQAEGPKPNVVMSDLETAYYYQCGSQFESSGEQLAGMDAAMAGSHWMSPEMAALWYAEQSGTGAMEGGAMLPDGFSVPMCMNNYLYDFRGEPHHQ
jgi:hypothetical protein